MHNQKNPFVLVIALLTALGLLTTWLPSSGVYSRLSGVPANQPQRNAPSGDSSWQGPVDAVGNPQAQPTALPNGVVVGHSIQNDVSPRLRDIPPKPIVKRTQDEIEDEFEEDRRPRRAPRPAVVDPVTQGFFTAGNALVAMPSTSQNFEGGSNRAGVYPPDTNGDVGPNHYVQMVNVQYQVWNKSGVSLLGPLNINTLWSGFGGPCETQNSGDPVVLYDPIADRWLLSQFTSSAPYGECVAISTTGDPTGSFYRYFFQFSTSVFYDYPHLGVWPDGYYMAANRFGSSFLGTAAIVFNRSRMLNGLSATYQEFDLGSSSSTLQPADLDGATLPSAGEPNFFVSLNGPNLLLYKFHVDWSTPANSTFSSPINLSAAAYNELCPTTRSCIPQPNTTVRLDGIGDRVLQRLAYRNFGDHESLVITHSVNAASSGLQAGLRWYEIRSPNATPTIYQQGTYAPDANNRWMGSIAMDQMGNIALGYSVSSSTVFPSIRYTGRLASDPLGQMSQGESTLIAGSGSQTGTASRWGDYSAMAVDPVDDCTFWYTTEYYTTTSTNSWRTRIGSFKFPTCGGGGPTATPTNTSTPTATLPSGTNLALNKPATASASCNTSETPDKAVNGSWTGGNSDKWCDNTSASKWLRVDLGTNFNVNQFVIRHAGAGGESTTWNTRDFNVQVSTDGVNWTTVVTVSGNTASTTTHNITATTARYVRLNVTTPTQTTDTAARIYEFEVYGSSGPTPTSTNTPTPTATSTQTNTPTPTATLPSGTNLALNKPATASASCNTSETPDKAVNGSWTGGNSDKWCDNVSASKWLQVDLGTNFNVNQFVVRHAGAGGESTTLNTRDFNIQVSTNGTSWTTVVTVSGNTASTTTHNITTTTARFVRLNVTAGTQGTSTTARIYELEVYGVSAPTPTATLLSGTNLALNKPATASASCNTSETPDKAVNGSWTGGNSDKWCDNTSASKWLQVDLGTNFNVNQFVVRHAGSGGETTDWNTRDFNIQVSTDGVNWTTVVTVSGNTASTTTHNITATTARYVRLNVTTPTQTTDTAARIYELEVYGS